MDFQGIFWHFKYRRPLAICRMTGVMLLQRHGNGSISRVQFFNSRFEKTRKTLVLMSTLQAWLTIISMTLNRNLHGDTSEILDNEWDHNLYRSCSQGVRNSPSWIVVTHCHNYPPTSSAPHEGTYGSQALIIFWANHYIALVPWVQYTTHVQDCQQLVPLLFHALVKAPTWTLRNMAHSWRLILLICHI